MSSPTLRPLPGFLCAVLLASLASKPTLSHPGDSARKKAPEAIRAEPKLNPIWETPANLMIEPPVLSSGRIYIINSRGILQALDSRDGVVRWDVPLLRRLETLSGKLTQQPKRPPAPMVADGHVFVSISSNEEGHLLSVSEQTGKIEWEYVSRGKVLLRGPILGPPTIAGRRVFLRTGGGLTAVNLADGKELWNVPIDPLSRTVPYGSYMRVVAGDNVVCTGAEAGEARAFRVTDGRSLWTHGSTAMESRQNGGQVQRSITVSRCSPILTGGKVCFVDGKGVAYAVRLRSGTELWRQEIGETWQLCAVGDRVYAVTIEGFVELSLATGKVLRTHELRGGAWSCAMSAGHAIICHNPREDAGWEVFDLKRWKTAWVDPDLHTFYGVATLDGMVVAGGIPSKYVAGGTYQYRPVLRVYRLPTSNG